MKSYDTDYGMKIVFEKDYDSFREDTSDIVPISIVMAFVIFLILI